MQKQRDSLRIGGDHSLSHDQSRLVHYTDRCLLQRHVKPDIKFHLPLSIVARPHEAGPILSWKADSLALVWLDSGITPCCKSLFAARGTNSPSCGRGD